MLLLATLSASAWSASGGVRPAATDAAKGDGGALTVSPDSSERHLPAAVVDGVPQGRTYDLVPAATGKSRLCRTVTAPGLA